MYMIYYLYVPEVVLMKLNMHANHHHHLCHLRFIVWFHTHTPVTHRRSVEILSGWRSQKPKFRKESMRLNWDFWKDVADQTKNKHPWGSYGYFLEQYII